MGSQRTAVGILSALVLLLAPPASAQFLPCTTTPTDITCTNAGSAAAPFPNNATGPNQNATTTNAGTANGFSSRTTGGGNATATNSGNDSNGFVATTTNGGNAAAINSGTNINGFSAMTFNGGSATATNSGSNIAGTGSGFGATTFGGGDATATNSGSNTGSFVAQTFGGGNSSATNSGTNGNGFSATTSQAGNAVAINSGSNVGGVLAQTVSGNATAINTGSDTGVGHAFADVVALTLVNGNAIASNSGTIGDAAAGNFSFLEASTQIAGNATATNSGRIAGGVSAQTLGTGTATAINSGTSDGPVGAHTLGGGDAIATNSGSAFSVAAATMVGGNAIAINSGTTGGLAAAAFGGGNAIVINSGASGPVSVDAALGTSTLTNTGTIAGIGPPAIEFFSGRATLTNILGGRVIGAIQFDGGKNTVNFVGGNWMFTFNTLASATVNAGGTPVVVSGNQVAVLDPTTFALADRSLTNFTAEISEMLQSRFGGINTGTGGAPLGFAGAPSSSVTDQAQAAFSGIPTVAMSYASNPKSIIGKALPSAAAPYDTTIWASGFGGERKQRGDGEILPTTDTAFGGAMGFDRPLGGNLRLGAFVGAGGSHEAVELNVQTIDATYVFGGAYGRFDWISQYVDFSLYGGGINNKSTRQVANNLAPSGLENATASYGGWFINPEVTYGYRIPFNAVTVTPRVRLRYVGGQLDGFSETGSIQNLSVGGRSINDIEERGEVELSTISGALKASVTIGIIGLERLGNPTINTVLLGQNLSFVTPGQANAFGGVLGMRMEYRARSNVALFVAGEGTAMSDRSDSFAASGGARVSF